MYLLTTKYVGGITDVTYSPTFITRSFLPYDAKKWRGVPGPPELSLNSGSKVSTRNYCTLARRESLGTRLVAIKRSPWLLYDKPPGSCSAVNECGHVYRISGSFLRSVAVHSRAGVIQAKPKLFRDLSKKFANI